MIPLQTVKRDAAKKHAVDEPWVDRWVVRKISIHLTWLLVHTPLTANQVTLISMALIAGGVVCLGVGHPLMPAAGAVGMFMGCVFDSCDGEIARFRKATSLRGVYLDTLSHAVTIPGMYLAAGIGQFLRHATIESLVLGAVAAVAATHPTQIAFMTLTHLGSGGQGASNRHGQPASIGGLKSLYLKTIGRASIFPNSMYVFILAAAADSIFLRNVGRGAIYWALAFYAVILGLEQIVAAVSWSREDRLKQGAP